MERRTFLKLLAALPFVGGLFRAPERKPLQFADDFNRSEDVEISIGGWPAIPAPAYVAAVENGSVCLYRIENGAHTCIGSLPASTGDVVTLKREFGRHSLTVQRPA